MVEVAELIGSKTIVHDEKVANRLHSKGRIGALVDNRLELSLVETLYLMDKEKIRLLHEEDVLSREEFVKKGMSEDKRFYLRYTVYENLRRNGHVVKTALKYGFDYRVYEKGVKPGKDHAVWLVHCFNENDKFTWKDFSKMMRVAHSVRKKVMVGVVDDEGDVTYWESNWVKL